MTIFRILIKKKEITLKKFLEDYQKLTLSFLKEIKTLTHENEDKMIEKLMSMAACATMPEYQSVMKQDIHELLQYHQVYPMQTRRYETFDPSKHDCRRILTNDEYIITKVIQDGFIRDDEVLQKSIVEVERR